MPCRALFPNHRVSWDSLVFPSLPDVAQAEKDHGNEMGKFTKGERLFIPDLTIRRAFTHVLGMRSLERMLLLTVAVAYTGYLVEEAMRLRAARLCRLAAGESPYERTHPKPRLVKKS